MPQGYIRTHPSGVYAFEFPAGSSPTQSDLTAVAGNPHGVWEEVARPGEAKKITDLAGPIQQTVIPSLGDCAMHCAAEVLGVKDILTAAGVISTPFPKKLAPKRIRKRANAFAGKTTNLTNLPSVIVAGNATVKKLNLPFSVATPIMDMTDGDLQFRWAKTTNIVRVFSRWIPGIGWGLLAYDVVMFTGCMLNCRGNSTKGRVAVTNSHLPVGNVSSTRLPGEIGPIPVGTETNALDALAESDRLNRK